MKVGVVLCAFFLLSASASPLLLPPGQLGLTPVAKVGNVTAVAFKEERGGRSPIFFILSTEDGHALFAVNGEKQVPLFSGPGLAPDILADGRYTVIGIDCDGVTKLHFLYGGEVIPVTLGEADEGSPAWSPDNRWLVFTAEREGRRKLYGLWLADIPWHSRPPSSPYVDSGDKHQGVILLFPGPGEERAPAFGPLGLAFLSNIQGSWDLWLLEGEDLTRARRTIQDVDPDSPVAWVGREIFVVRDGQPGLVSLDGGFFQAIEGPAGWWQAPGAPFFPVLDGMLYRAQLPEPLSPDFALVRCKPGENVGELWLCCLDGKGWKVAEAVDRHSVAWSPDGTYIAYIRRLPGSGDPMEREAGYCPDYRELWVAQADGTEPRLVFPFPTTGEFTCAEELGWSADGDRIYFEVAGSPTHAEIWSVDLCGGSPTYHTWGWDLAFHADGTISGITRGGIPFIYDPRTEEERYVKEWGQIFLAFFSPDAQAFVGTVEGVFTLVDLRKGEAIPIMPEAWARPRARGERDFAWPEVSWAPDGAGFAFVASFDGDDEIFFYACSTGTLTKLTDNDWDDRCPIFSPNGKYLAYISYAEGLPRIWILCLEDGRVMKTPWEAFPGYSGLFWRPQGRQR